jgi:GTP cyclohydrolase I
MTNEIAAMLEEMLNRAAWPWSSKVHTCAASCGGGERAPRMVTTAMLGEFKHDRERQ